MGAQPIPEGYGVGVKQGACPDTLKQMHDKKCLYLLCTALREEGGCWIPVLLSANYTCTKGRRITEQN